MIRGMLLWREEKEAGEGREKEKEKKGEEGKGGGEERLCTLCTVALVWVCSPLLHSLHSVCRPLSDKASLLVLLRLLLGPVVPFPPRSWRVRREPDFLLAPRSRCCGRKPNSLFPPRS